MAKKKQKNGLAKLHSVRVRKYDITFSILGKMIDYSLTLTLKISSVWFVSQFLLLFYTLDLLFIHSLTYPLIRSVTHLRTHTHTGQKRLDIINHFGENHSTQSPLLKPA